ncbi:hypothetical protein IAT38_005835 [Cryptococcus sp. DSM 104549]
MASPYSPPSPGKRSPSPVFDFSAPPRSPIRASSSSPSAEPDAETMLDNIDLDTESAVDPWKASETAPSAGSSSRFSEASMASVSAQRYSKTAASTPATEMMVGAGEVPIVLGVAVVDFNHLIGPTVEFAYPPTLQAAITDDEDLARLLPFLALPDGAHLSEEDYSYFHCTYSPSDSDVPTNVPSSQTLFGISCNRQLASSELKRRPSDVTRSMVQKAVIVIASQPVFGPIRDRLGVVTRAYFAQRDFTQTEILEDFYRSLETSLEGKSGEGAIYMGTSLRDLVHKFRHRTLVLLKLLMLQKRIMLFGYPVEKLCTYQYSLVSLIPGLLLSLKDSGSPDLDHKSTRVRPTSLRTSDRASMLRYMGLPLRVFGRDAVFQPYMPLQQMDMLQAKSWLVGTTNQIVTQQRDCKYDLLVNIDNNTFEFSDPKVERLAALTPADRKWMDDVVRTVEETWTTPEGERPSFRGSDDDLRARFEEYICAALSSIKFADFLTKGNAQDISIVAAGSGEGNVIQSFGEQWILAFKQTEAYDLWNGCTDPALFDICEPKHPCEGKVNPVSDLGLRLTEGIHDLRLDQQLAPTREALSSAFAAGSSSIFKAFDGVRSEVSSRLREREEAQSRARESAASPTGSVSGRSSPAPPKATSPTPPVDIKATLGGIGAGIGGFFGSKVASFRAGREEPAKGLRPMSLVGSSSAGSVKNLGRSPGQEGQGPLGR